MKRLPVVILALIAPVVRAQTINAVYFGQTHVMKATDAYFGMVGNRETLIKAHVTAPGTTASPAVTATLTLNSQNLVVPLNGPATLPNSIPDGPGVVQHSFTNTFTGYIPAAWMGKGLQVTVNAGAASTTITDMKVSAPSKVIMTMTDVHYFGKTTGDYPANTFAEIEAKWPVADLEVRRLNNVVFRELVIPPRSDVGAQAVRIRSKAEYQAQTGLGFDGEQAAALEWNGALKRAAGTSGRWSLFYLNVYNAVAGGQAGGFAGVGNGTDIGILHHELGHALSLPHWGDNAAYPYKGDMYGIQAPSNYNETHAGPTWAFDLRTKAFIPPTVQSNNVGGKPAGTYKVDPMQGGGEGWQEPAYLANHFSDYSVNQMRSYLNSHVVVWNPALNSFAQWNQTTGDYTTAVSNNGVQFPQQRDVQVISILASMSGAKPSVNMVYPPIGPYTSGLIRLFDPTVAADRTAANSIFSPTNGSDYCVRVVQGGVTKTYMLAASALTSPSLTSAASLETEAINLPADDGAVTRIELLSTPNAEDNGLPANPAILYTWAPLMPATATFDSPPTASGSTAVTMTAQPGEVEYGQTGGTVEYLFTETSGNPGGTSSSWQTSRSYTDTGLQPNTTYNYTVSMRAGVLNSTTSAPVSATTPGTMIAGNISVVSSEAFTVASGSGYKAVTNLGTFTAAGADKLVVVIGQENANNDPTMTYGVRYNGIQMIEAVQQSGSNKAGSLAIYYLDDPGPVGTGITVSGYNPNGGLGTAYALTGTRPGFGASNSRTGANTTSVPLTTSAANSLVIAALQNSGNPNSAGTPAASSPLTQTHSASWGSQWGGLATGHQQVAAPGNITPTFTASTGSSYSINIAAVEFLAATTSATVWTQTAGGAQSWNTAANWLGNSVPSPVSGDTADFSTVNIAANTTLTLAANRTAGHWKFGDTSGTQNWTVDPGHTITLAGSSPGIEVVQNTTTLGSIIAGTDGLIKTGAGTLILSAANTYTGSTIIDAGKLRVTGSLAATPVSVNATGILQTGSANSLTSSNPVTLDAGGTLDLFGNSVSIGALASNASSTITNTGTATSASTATTAGTPNLTDALSINAAISASALQSLVTDGAARRTQIVLNNANGNATTAPTNLSNTFSGGLVLAHNPSGTRLLLNGSNTAAAGIGPVIVGQTNTDKAGVYFSAATTLPNDLVINTALGTDRVGIRVDAAVSLTGKITANLAPATFTANNATNGHATLTGQITGASGLVLDITSSSAAATSFNVTLDNTGPANNYAGDTLINLNPASGKSATLNLAAPHQIPNGTGAGSVLIHSNGTGVGMLNLGGFSETINGLGGNGVVEGGGGTPVFTIGDNNASSTFSGVIRNTTGNLWLVKTGSGTISFSGNNSYTGNTTIAEGTLAMDSNRISSSPLISIGNGAILQSSGGITLSANQSIAGSAATGFVTTSSSTGLITTGGSTLSSSGTLTITRLSILGSGNRITGGDLQSGGTGSFQRGLLVGNNGTGTLTLSGGSLTSNGGTTNPDVLGATASSGDGTFIIDGGSYTNTGTLSLGNGQASGTFILASGSATLHTLRFHAGNSGAKTSAIVNLDGGSLTLANITVTSGLTKQLNFNGGQLIASANLPAFSGLTLNVRNNGATINTNGFALTLADPLLNSGGTSNGGLTKIGTGTLRLAGANTYTGNTMVVAGTLELMNNARLRFVIGADSGTNNSISGAGTAVIDGEFDIDTSAADALAAGSWTLENVATLTGAYGPNFRVSGFTDAGNEKWTKSIGAKTYTFDETTGVLTLEASTTFASWIDSFFPGATDPSIIGPKADPDGDNIPNAVEMVIGGNPESVMDAALLPTIGLVSDPAGMPGGDYLLFTYRRTDLSVLAGITAECVTNTNLGGTWTPADSIPGVLIQVDDNFTFDPPAATATDRVRAYLPRSSALSRFVSLRAMLP